MPGKGQGWMIGPNNPMFGRERTKEWRENHSKFMKGNKYGKLKSTKGIKLHLSDEQREVRRQRMAKVNAKGFINKGGRCSYYSLNGIDAQGRYELIYLRRQLKLGVDIIRAKPIKTPLGWYTPDFDLGTHYVDVKSTYTIRTCVENGQWEKIRWVRKNIKRVKLVVLKEKEVEKEFLELLSKQTSVNSA